MLCCEIECFFFVGGTWGGGGKGGVFGSLGQTLQLTRETHDVSITRTRQNASASARRAASRSPSR